MLTEECHLNPFLQDRGIEVVDTDLGERIVQLRDEPPSHIVLPAIHIKKEEVGETFHKHLGHGQGATDPNYLTEAARGHLRDKFMNADAAITGVNFGIAERVDLSFARTKEMPTLACPCPSCILLAWASRS